MKLRSTLPERAGFLHAVPIFDLFGLLLIAILLGPSFLSQAGVEVDLPVSRYRLARQADTTVVTITPGDPPVLWLGREKVDRETLVERLEARSEASVRAPVAYIRSDESVEAGFERRVAEAALGAGFRVYLLGKPLTDS